jgi:hypothetical protein
MILVHQFGWLTWGLVRDSEKWRALTPADITAILVDQEPVVELNSNGQGGFMSFPDTALGTKWAFMLRDQLNAIEKAR